MTRMLSGGWLIAFLALGAAIQVWPAAGFSQNPGQIHGTVLDSQGQPIDGAIVTFDFRGGRTYTVETTTEADGTFIRVGLPSGPYLVTAHKDGAGTQSLELRLLGFGEPMELEFTLEAAEARGQLELSEEEKAALERLEGVNTAFAAGLAATRAGNYEAAVRRFNEAIELHPKCHECHHNLGLAYTEMEDYENAEAAFQRALQVKPDHVPAYQGLAVIYTAQRRVGEAAEASAQVTKLMSGASQGGARDPATVFNQGLISWNAGNIDEAQAQFQETLRLDPSYGEAHYWLGLAHLNGGKLPEAAAELEEYLALEPDGRLAEEAKGMLTQIKPGP